MNIAEHVMIDLETLGTSSDAAIVQIGAVTDNGVEFKATIDFDSALEHGVADAKALAFWFGQSDEAQQGITTNVTCLSDAMLRFESWLAMHTNEKTKFWAHASFDFPILQRTSKLVLGKTILPNYRNLLDMRTIEYLLGDHIQWDDREGTHHDALDDAKFQMHHLIKMLEHQGN